MRWSDLPLNPSPRVLRQFAGLWIVFFCGVASWHWLAHAEARLALLLTVIGVTAGLAGLIRPSLLRPVFVAWLILAFPIGWAVSRVVLVALFSMITPVAFFFRLRGRDQLRLRRRTGEATYWTTKGPPGDVRSYLRQF